MIWDERAIRNLMKGYERGWAVSEIAVVLDRTTKSCYKKAQALGLVWGVVPPKPKPEPTSWKESKAQKRPSHNTGRFTQRAVLPGVESTEIKNTTKDPPIKIQSLKTICERRGYHFGSGVRRANQIGETCLDCREPVA